MVEITEKEFKQLTEYVKKNYGINLKTEKKVLVMGRLQGVLLDAGCNSFTEYFEYVLADRTGQAVITLIDKISTNHTFFMRESGHFDFLRDHVLPGLKESVHEKDLRIWCAASSTGEEAYTLAMLLDEYLGPEKSWWDKKILATDISQSALETAVRGIYSDERITPLPVHWKQNYFRRYDEENWIVEERIRNEIIFRKFNLMESFFPFKKKFHVIFCRNVMIYFDNETRDLLVDKFYSHLEPGGYLFIGHSETINRVRSEFQYIMPAVYRKN